MGSEDILYHVILFQQGLKKKFNVYKIIFVPIGIMFHFFPLSALCLLSEDIYDYHFVSQGKVEIPGVDDAKEMQDTDVSI